MTNNVAVRTRKIVEKLILRNVLAIIAWQAYRFDNVAEAKRVIPLSHHQFIFHDYIDLQLRFPGGDQAMWDMAKEVGATNGKNLWAKLWLDAIDPTAKYAENIEMQKAKERRPHVYNTKAAFKRLRYRRVAEDSQALRAAHKLATEQQLQVLELFQSMERDTGKEAFTYPEIKAAATADLQKIWQMQRQPLIDRGLIQLILRG